MKHFDINKLKKPGKEMNTDSMTKALRAKTFENEMNKAEKGLLRERKSRIKKGGFSSEKDYFTNVNPLTGQRRKNSYK